jgi:hypothetical protein
METIMPLKKTAEVVEMPQEVGASELLEQLRERRRAAEHNFNRAFSDVANHRTMLQKSINAMEKTKREFHVAEEAEANELMRQGLKR